jgi:hypothetical protein
LINREGRAAPMRRGATAGHAIGSLQRRHWMKRLLLAGAASLAALAMAGCAEDYYGPYGGGGMAYYDSFYGPYYGGYWAPDGAFYYRGGRGGGFHRDDGHHFHREPGNGYRGVHANPGFHGWSRGGHGDGGHPGGRGHGGDHDARPHGDR